MRDKYWIEGLISKENDIREIEVTKDGLLIRAPYRTFKDLLIKRPTNSSKDIWYFNNTLDRKIANMYENIVIANLQLVWEAGFEIIT